MAPAPASSLRRIGGSVPAGAAAAIAVQLLLMGRAHAPGGVSFFLALAIVVGVWHLLAALALSGRRDDRPWALTLLVLPGALASMPLSGGTLRGLLIVLALAAGAVILGTVAIRRPGAPFACAVTGAALGWAVSYAILRWTPSTRERALAAAVLGLATVLAFAVAAVQPAGRLLRLAAHPAAAVLYLAAGWSAVLQPSVPAKPAGRYSRGAPPAVLIVLDSVRADHLKSYGYGRDTMPALERFAARHARRFDRSLSSAASSLPSHGSMFTGLLPARHGAHANDPTLPDAGLAPLRRDVPTLAQLLRRAGYWTAGISGNFAHLARPLGLGRGFEWYDASPGWQARAAELNPYRGGPLPERLQSLGRWYPFSRSQFFERPAPTLDRRSGELVARALEALEAAGPDPFFLFVNLFDAHQPYRPPAGFRDGAPGARLRERSGSRTVVEGRPTSEEELRGLIAAYDGELRYLDSRLERLLAALEAHPGFDEMLVIVIGDHGEGFGEHGLFHHGVDVYDEFVRVPLFIKPGRSRPFPATGGPIPAAFQSVDVFPTVLAHAGLPVPAGLDGVPWGAARSLSTSEEFLSVWASNAGQELPRKVEMIEAPPWKLRLTSTGDRRLFRIPQDPGETRDLAAQEPEVVEHLEAARRAIRGGDAPAYDPSHRLPSDLVRSLRALGYLN